MVLFPDTLESLKSGELVNLIELKSMTILNSNTNQWIQIPHFKYKSFLEQPLKKT